MFLTVTILFSAILAKFFIGNPLLGFFFGFFSYYLLVAIPHWPIIKSQKKFSLILIILDYFVSLLLFFFLSVIFFNKDFTFSINFGREVSVFNFTIWCCVFGAILNYCINNLLPLSPNNKFYSYFLKIEKFFFNEDKSNWGILIHFSLAFLCFIFLFDIIQPIPWQEILYRLQQ